jgi:mRNA-degrading endonuclease RelE of RelBE toxin-antitoxin system
MKNSSEYFWSKKPRHQHYKVVWVCRTPQKILGGDVRKKLNTVIIRLAENPYLQQSKKRKGNNQELWEHRIGKDYRLIYEIVSLDQVILIYWFGHHQQDFRKKNFDKQLKCKYKQRNWYKRLEP